MAETLVGEHHRLTCDDCGYTFVCGADRPTMAGKQAICPNCGATAGRIDLAPCLPADAVLVDRSAFVFRQPRRWDLATFRGNGPKSEIYVKRVVGLPGETVELRHGDVYADGVVQRKNLAQQRAMATLVHDNSHTAPSLASRWLPETADSGWRQAGARFWRAATSGKSDDETIDWLSYHHRRRRPGEPDIADELPVSDDCGYNQTLPVTQSHLVRDLMVRCRMRVADAPTAIWLLTDGVSQFLVELDFTQSQAKVTQDGRRLGATSWPTTKAAESVLIELALCDEQVLLGLDGQEVLRLAWIPADLPLRPTSRPIAVGTRGNSLEIWDLVVLRDLYYGPGHLQAPAEHQYLLADDEYFVLGDNSPDSLDSRNWPQPGIAMRNFIGKPLLAYPAGLRSNGPTGRFQVPDLGRFRYIH